MEIIEQKTRKIADFVYDQCNEDSCCKGVTTISYPAIYQILELIVKLTERVEQIEAKESPVK